MWSSSVAILMDLRLLAMAVAHLLYEEHGKAGDDSPRDHICVDLNGEAVDTV